MDSPPPPPPAAARAAEPSAPLSALKKQIADKLAVPPPEQRLARGVVDGPFAPTADGKMPLYVQPADASLPPVVVRVPPTATLADIKAAIADKPGMPPAAEQASAVFFVFFVLFFVVSHPVVPVFGARSPGRSVLKKVVCARRRRAEADVRGCAARRRCQVRRRVWHQAALGDHADGRRRPRRQPGRARRRRQGAALRHDRPDG